MAVDHGVLLVLNIDLVHLYILFKELCSHLQDSLRVVVVSVQRPI